MSQPVDLPESAFLKEIPETQNINEKSSDDVIELTEANFLPKQQKSFLRRWLNL